MRLFANLRLFSQEHHLQAVISAAHAAAHGRQGDIPSASIPVPEARPAGDHVNYDSLFPAQFAQPATYIRFSSTVEDCTGVAYCMDDEDVTFLTQMNLKHASQQSPRKRRGAAAHQDGAEGKECSEDWFEQIVTSFEETSAARQPFASVDHPPVLPFEELAAAFDEEMVDEGARGFAREIYEHWKSRRSQRSDQRLMAQLKTPRIDASGGQDADDNDPFVCFRRREFRQARKTRGRDAQVIEKLKRLRKELEDGRFLLDFVRKREANHKEDLQSSRDMYQGRYKLRKIQHEMKIMDDNRPLLIDQPKVDQPRPKLPQQKPSDSTIRLRLNEPENSDMIDLQFKLAERARHINQQIQDSVMAHDKWNRHFVDNTESALCGAITPSDMFLPEDQRTSAQGRGFVGVKVEEKNVPRQQPTPPDSVVADSQSEKSAAGEDDAGPPSPADSEQLVQWANPSEYSSFKNTGRFRRRTGRGGRVMLDRHNFPTRKLDTIDERFQFDRDSGDEESDTVPDINTNELMSLRVHWTASGPPVRRPSGTAGSRDAHMTNSHPTQTSQPVQQKAQPS